MKHLVRVSLLVALLALLAFPLVAQEDDVEPGTGAPIIEPNIGEDIKTTNPIIVQDGPSDDVIDLIFPDLIQIDPQTGGWAPNTPNSLAESWEISDDGTIYTFNLRDEFVWSDGTPITAQDFLWHWDAIQGGANSPLASLRDNVVSIEAPDDYTLVVTFAEQDCTALDTLNDFSPVPAHVFADVFGDDFENMEDNDYNLNPTVTGSRFTFLNFRPGEQVTLLANPDYPDAYAGAVIPEGYIYKTVADQVVEMEQFYAGELTWVPSVPDAARDEVRERAAAGEFQIYEALAGSIRFLAFNLADPANPQNALDEEGNPIDQGNHPVLGDVRVRQALAYGLDWEAVNQGAFFGTGIQVASFSRPASWAEHPDLAPYPFDQERARELLEEAGWTDSDGDGIRECNGCLYAEEGTPLAFELQTNSGNTSQEAMYTVMQDVWGEIGFDVELSILDFNTILESFTAQTYDAVGLFWDFSNPDNPNGAADVFTPAADVVDAGFNTGSYNNERVNELLEEARTLPGCDQQARAELYHEVQEILHEDLPWLFVNTTLLPLVAQADVENWGPTAASSRWNVDAWMVPNN